MSDFSWMKRAVPPFWKFPIVIGYMILGFSWAVIGKVGMDSWGAAWLGTLICTTYAP
jgi:hypothetical protein